MSPHCVGPGKAWSAKEQGEYLFQLAGKKPWLIGVPVGLMDAIISVFDNLTKVFPNLEVHHHPPPICHLVCDQAPASLLPSHVIILVLHNLPNKHSNLGFRV